MDRFERIVLKAIQKNGGSFGEPSISLIGPDVVRLLRREHAWTIRMVKKIEAWSSEYLLHTDDVIGAILDQLNQRRK